MLRFLIAAREEVNSTQLRDDLLSMLVAGHETTGSALTWTLYLLVNNPDKMAKAQVKGAHVEWAQTKLYNPNRTIPAAAYGTGTLHTPGLTRLAGASLAPKMGICA